MGAGEALPPRKAVAPSAWGERNLHPLNMNTRAELARMATRGDINLVDWYGIEAKRLQDRENFKVEQRDRRRNVRQALEGEVERKDRVIKYQRRAMVLALVAMVCFGVAAWFK